MAVFISEGDDGQSIVTVGSYLDQYGDLYLDDVELGLFEGSGVFAGSLESG